VGPPGVRSTTSAPGARRKGLFEGEEEAVSRKEAKLEYGAGLEGVNEDLAELSVKETEFLPITTRRTCTSPARRFGRSPPASSSKSRSSTGPTPTNSAPGEEFSRKHPGQWNPYAALPQLRLLTYQMPEELLAIAMPANSTSST
jgi:hypothetical protein